jgi:hypothetical protein
MAINVVQLGEHHALQLHFRAPKLYCAMAVLATSGNRYTLRSAQMLY